MNIQTIEDSQLVKHYLMGNEDALEVLITRHKNRIYGYIFSKVLNKNIAEDIFQDTFVKVILTLREENIRKKVSFFHGLCVLHTI